MRIPAPVIVAAIAACLVGGKTSAAEFKGGNMFVSSSGDGLIYEFGPDGEVLRTIGSGSGLTEPRGIAFGPDGNLYVASFTGDVVLVFDGDGELVRTIGAGSDLDQPVFLAFAPAGRLLVTSANRMSLFAFDFGGSKLFELEGSTALAGTGTGVAVAPNGHMFLANTFLLFEFDADGVEIDSRLLNPFNGDEFAGIRYGPGGLLYVVVDNDDIERYSDGLVSMGPLATTGLSVPRGLAFGPNGNLFVVDNGVVGEYDPAANGQKIDDHAVGKGLSDPWDIAFAPYAFSATVSGTLAQPGLPPVKIKQKNVRLQVGPGAVEMSLLVADDAADSADLASVFGTDPLLFRGYEGSESADASKRSVMGVQVPAATRNNGLASVRLSLIGKKKSQVGVGAGLEAVDGTLHRAAPTGVFEGKITAKKLLD